MASAATGFRCWSESSMRPGCEAERKLKRPKNLSNPQKSALNCPKAFFGVDYIFQFFISRNKLEFLYSLMAFVDVVTLAPFLVFNQVRGNPEAKGFKVVS